LLNDRGIIRNKLKIEAAKINAQAYLNVVDEFGDFRKFIWSFAGEAPIQNPWKSLSEIPASTKESDCMSNELKKKRVQICWLNYNLCFYASGWHGQ
jgi:DNA-3-methyladenine glycosylase I